MLLTIDIFGADAFSKIGPNGFERRFNRAVFDVMVYFFSDPGTRNAALVHREKVFQAFGTLSRDDAFRTTLETTTKSVDATFNRLRYWGNALATAVRQRLPAVEAINDMVRRKSH